MKIKDSKGAEIAMFKESHALLIGAADYEYWPDLPGVEDDILAVSDALKEHGFSVDIVRDPDRAQLLSAFDDFINKYGYNIESRLIFYFAGHGHTVKKSYGDDMGYIVPTDAPNPNRDLRGFKGKAIDMQLIEVYAKKVESKHVLFLFDSCFSGSIFSLSRAVPANISYKTAKPVRQFITAGSANETVPDESVFRKQFVEALKGDGDVDGDGYITGSELGEFLQNNVINYTKSSQHPQYGKIRNPNLDKGDFVFALNKVDSPGSTTMSDISIDVAGEREKLRKERKMLAKAKVDLESARLLQQEQNRVARERQEVEFQQKEYERQQQYHPPKTTAPLPSAPQPTVIASIPPSVKESLEPQISDGALTMKRPYGGEDMDMGYAIKQTRDGGYVLLGTTESFEAESEDVLLIKTDANGNKLWHRTYGGDELDMGYSIDTTNDGGFIILGHTESFDKRHGDMLLIKADNNGILTWKKTYGGDEYEIGRSVQQTSDGGYIMLGTTESYGAGNLDMYLTKIDKDGNVIWTRTYGGEDEELGTSVQQTSDGGYILLGTTESFGKGNIDMYLVKTDNNGIVTWTKTIGGEDEDKGNSVQQTSDGGYILFGTTESFGADSYNMYLAKTDALGNEQWTKTFGKDEDDEGFSVQQTSDGGYILVGRSNSFDEDNNAFNIYLVKADSSGNEIWHKLLGGEDKDEGYDVIQSKDGGYAVIGFTESFGAGEEDIYLIKTDINGNVH
ncbi:caspase domain-containing protein [Thermodesulfobacteriota bacterium]